MAEWSSGHCGTQPLPLRQPVSKNNEEFRIQNEEFCIQNEGFCIQNVEFCRYFLIAGYDKLMPKSKLSRGSYLFVRRGTKNTSVKSKLTKYLGYASDLETRLWIAHWTDHRDEAARVAYVMEQVISASCIYMPAIDRSLSALYIHAGA